MACENLVGQLDQKITTRLKELGLSDPLKYEWVGVGKDVSQTKGGGGGKMGDFVFTGKNSPSVKVDVQLGDLSAVEVFDPNDTLKSYEKKIEAGECIYETPLANTIKDNKTCSLAIGTKYMWVGLLKTEGVVQNKYIFVFKNEADTAKPVYYKSHLSGEEGKKGFTAFIMSKLAARQVDPSAPPAVKTEEEENKKTTPDEKLKKAEAELEELDGQSTGIKNSATARETRLKLKDEIKLLKKKQQKKNKGGGRRRTRRKRRRRKKKKTVRRKKKRRTKRKRKRVKRKTRRRR